jgi:hypothetical protein
MSDKQRLLALLKRRGGWVGLLEIGRVASPYSITKRVSELRREGYTVQNKTWRAKGRTHSAYRLAA